MGVIEMLVSQQESNPLARAHERYAPADGPVKPFRFETMPGRLRVTDPVPSDDTLGVLGLLALLALSTVTLGLVVMGGFVLGQALVHGVHAGSSAVVLDEIGRRLRF